MDPTALYRDLVIEHNRAPRRFGAIAGATHAGRADNPLCGDDLVFQLQVADGRIADLGFAGEGCAVAIAAASMLGEAVAGGSPRQLADLRAAFERLLRSGQTEPMLGDLGALAGLHAHPARHRCALLAFDAMAAALGDAARADPGLAQ
jgi:nitrogen fixation NifU-like protein